MTNCLLAFLFSIILTIPSMAQEGLYYYGSNKKTVQTEEEAITFLEVEKKSKNKYLINTHQKAGDSWVKTMKEKIKLKDDLNQKIIYNTNMFFPRKIYREMKQLGQGVYHFSESKKGTIIREGTSSSFLPLHLDGSVNEYHMNGKLKSNSIYRDNQLISNENWLSDGTKYIDSIFYSADEKPIYKNGEEYFKTFLLTKLAESDQDLSQIEDEIVIAWVVMEDGQIDGVMALQGKSLEMNEFLVSAIRLIPGEWTPAMLNGSPVRYFMTFPLNIIHDNSYFQFFDYSWGVLHYERY